MTANDRPHNDTCDDLVGTGIHTLESAWGHTWCECAHTAVVEQHDPTHDGIDPDSLPAWWSRALREALDATEDSGFDLETAWVHLRELARDLAAERARDAAEARLAYLELPWWRRHLVEWRTRRSENRSARRTERTL